MAFLIVGAPEQNSPEQKRKSIHQLQAEKYSNSLKADSISDTSGGKGGKTVNDREDFEKTMSKNLIKSGIYIFLTIAFLLIAIYFLRKSIREL